MAVTIGEKLQELAIRGEQLVQAVEKEPLLHQDILNMPEYKRLKAYNTEQSQRVLK